MGRGVIYPITPPPAQCIRRCRASSVFPNTPNGGGEEGALNRLWNQPVGATRRDDVRVGKSRRTTRVLTDVHGVRYVLVGVAENRHPEAVARPRRGRLGRSQRRELVVVAAQTADGQERETRDRRLGEHRASRYRLRWHARTRRGPDGAGRTRIDGRTKRKKKRKKKTRATRCTVVVAIAIVVRVVFVRRCPTRPERGGRFPYRVYRARVNSAEIASYLTSCTTRV